MARAIQNNPLGSGYTEIGDTDVLNVGGLQLPTGGLANAILDEDSLSSDSDTALATQQSIKYYVDNVAKQYSLEPVTQDYTPIGGKTFAVVRSGFFFSAWRNSTMIRTLGAPVTNFDALWRHTYWQFSYPSAPTTWSAPMKFATENDFYTFLESYIPSAGGVYSEGAMFKVYEMVDNKDPYPVRVRHRNSLVASMRGRGDWVRGRASGIVPNFNAPAYYLNFYNEMGQRFVQTIPGAVPATNNDGVVWYHRGSRGALWRWPHTSGGSVAVLPGYRDAAWDDVAGAYVSPAPAGSYIIQNPFFLCESNPRLLQIISTGIDSNQRTRELFFPMALVFPVVLSARYYGFVVVPHGSDSFITEKLDESAYDFVLSCKFRHTSRKIYAAPISQAVFSDAEHSLFQLRRFPFELHDSSIARPSTDKDSIPIQIDIARRNKVTGARSPWFPVYRVNRRIHHAAFRVDPAPWKR